MQRVHISNAQDTTHHCEQSWVLQRKACPVLRAGYCISAAVTLQLDTEASHGLQLPSLLRTPTAAAG